MQRIFFKIYITLCATQGDEFKEFEIDEPLKFSHPNDVDPTIEHEINEHGFLSTLIANCPDFENPIILLSVKFRVAPSKMHIVGNLVPASIAGT